LADLAEKSGPRPIGFGKRGVASTPVEADGGRADEIVAMPLEGKSMLDLPSGVRAVAERGVLRFVPQVGRCG
jgi:hypothetical protein